MRRYIFVLGIWNRRIEEMSFKHLLVRAKDTDDAYILGQRHAETLGWIPVKSDESANDYVIQL